MYKKQVLAEKAAEAAAKALEEGADPGKDTGNEKESRLGSAQEQRTEGVPSMMGT